MKFGCPDQSRFAYSGPKFTVDQPVLLTRSPNIILRRGTIRLSPDNSFLFGLFGLNNGDSTEVSDGRAPLELDGGRLILDLSQPSKQRDGATSETTEITAPLLAALSELNFESLALRNCSLTIKRNTSNDSFHDLNVLIIRNRDSSSISAEGSAQLRGQTLTFDTLVHPTNESDGQRLRLRGEVTSDLLTASFDGQLDTRNPIAFNAKRTELSVTDLRAAARWLGTPWPKGDSLRDFHAQGPMTWNDGRLSFERAQYSIDGSSGSGALSVSLTAGSPVIEGTVAFESLEIAPYLNLKAQDQQQFLLSGIFPAIADTHGNSPQSIITEVDADLRISAAKVTVNGSHIGPGRCNVGNKGPGLARRLRRSRSEQRRHRQCQLTDRHEEEHT